MLQRAAQHELDLRVQAAQFIGGPPLHRVVYRRVQPHQEWFALRQNSLPLLFLFFNDVRRQLAVAHQEQHQ